MNKVPYTNAKKHAVHIGSTLVMPGDTRMVDPRNVPGYQSSKPKAAAPAAPAEHDEALLALLDGNTAEITAALGGLDAAQLEALELAEARGKTRKGVLAAIGAAFASLKLDGANLGDDETAAD